MSLIEKTSQTPLRYPFNTQPQIFHPPHRNSELYFSPQMPVTKRYTVVVRAI
jgi:hypothetical protein